MQYKYQITPNIPPPRNSRRIYTPVDDSNERVVSDLIPTEAITASFPMIGDVRLGEIDYMNAPDGDPFAQYILRKITPEPGEFTRLTFSREITAEESKIHFHEEWDVDNEMYWNPILHWVKFVEDAALAEPSRDIEGNTVYLPFIYAKWGYTPSYQGPSAIRIRKYLSSTPFARLNLIGQKPGEVHWNVPGSGERNFPKCLHPDLRIRTTVNGGDWRDDPPMFEKFPATNMLTWQAHNYKASIEKQDVLYVQTVVKVYPPPIGEINKLTQ